MRVFLFAVVAVLLPSLGHARAFDVRRDTFAFANETVFQYDVTDAGRLEITHREKPPAYAHRCFVMSRAALQFWQFARFEPRQPRMNREQYAVLVRRISRIPVWSKGPKKRIVVPGFSDLQTFSKAMPTVLQENMGTWLPSYLRVGNYRMAMGHPRSGQAMVARWLEESLSQRRPRAVYIARFPHLNHCMIAYRMEPLPVAAVCDRRSAQPVAAVCDRRSAQPVAAVYDRRSAQPTGVGAHRAPLQGGEGDVRFWLYDPNYPRESAWLDYHAAERSFDFQPRWYFPGGRVNVMRVYISPFH